MNIALIGGSGFIGTRLAAQLIDQGHNIRILDIVPSDTYPDYFVKADITKQDELSAALKDIDVIYHLAAAHRDDVFPRSIYYDVNVEGTKNVVAAAQDNHIQTLFFTSSVAVYALNGGESKEDDTPAPFNDYGRSKLQAEDVLRTWAAETKGARLALIRLVATFGPGNRGNVFTLINQIARNRFIMIGAGKNKKTVAYVENVAAFLAGLTNREPGTYLYNYADKPDMSMKEMVATIRGIFGYKGLGLKIPYILGLMGGYVFDILSRISGKSFPISAIRVKKFAADTIVNCQKIDEETGFERPATLEQGLAAMIKSDFAPTPKQQ